MTILDDAANSLSHWTKYYIWKNLYEQQGDADARAILGDIGAILDGVRQRNPGKLPGLDGLPLDIDPHLLLGKALNSEFKPEDRELPKVTAMSLFEQVDEIIEAFERRRQASQTPDPNDEINELAPVEPPVGVPPVPDGSLPPPPASGAAKWRISLFLRKIHCKKETAPEVLTDDFQLLGSYQYGTESGSLRQVAGQFDTNTQKTYFSAENPHGRLLATCLIPPSQDTVAFATKIFAFEEDGMTAAEARLLAGLLGNLATLGINGLLTFASASGVALPPEAREAYDNLGLPFLIGFLAKAFGPEPFIPVPAYARTRWPDIALPPKWDGKIPEIGGQRRSHLGSDTHDGNVTLDEAVWEDPIDPSVGSAGPVLVAKTDGGKYYIYLRFVVEPA